MKKRFFAGLLSLSAALMLTAGDPYEGRDAVAVRSELDGLLRENWQNHRLETPVRASDSVRVRRIYLDLAGRLPTVEEARSFVSSARPDKDVALIGRLLDDPGFVDFWTLKLADRLRVKSEFPINLWPNAVYVYTRRLHDFWSRREPYHEFAAALLTASGSNFRVPEVNFYRATAKRSPETLAALTAQTVWNLNFAALPEAERRNLTEFFTAVRYKPTKEWKEEIVFVEPLPAADLTLPDGSKVRIEAGGDRRAALADYCRRDPDGRLARAAANWVWHELFGTGLLEPADGMNLDSQASGERREILDLLAAELKQSGYDLRTVIRLAAESALHQATSLPPADADVETLRKQLALYPVRRLDAEVLQDAIRDLTGTSYEYSSVIPEPFTFLPSEARTITLADGSISSAFLILFGRPARDSGLLSERVGQINAKQRLYLFNSGNLYGRLNRIAKRGDFKGLRPAEALERLYWLFYSRPPSGEEQRLILDTYRAQPPRERWRMLNDVSWILLNTKEFLYQH